MDFVFQLGFKFERGGSMLKCLFFGSLLSGEEISPIMTSYGKDVAFRLWIRCCLPAA